MLFSSLLRWCMVFSLTYYEIYLLVCESCSVGTNFLLLHGLYQSRNYRPEYWVGNFSSPGDLPNSGVPKPDRIDRGFLLIELSGKPKNLSVDFLINLAILQQTLLGHINFQHIAGLIYWCFYIEFGNYIRLELFYFLLLLLWLLSCIFVFHFGFFVNVSWLFLNFCWQNLMCLGGFSVSALFSFCFFTFKKATPFHWDFQTN